MKKSIAVVFVLLIPAMLGGCSRHHHPLAAGKKARLVAETVSNVPRCSAFKTRLASPAMDDDAIDDVYHDAMKAQCINKDI